MKFLKTILLMLPVVMLLSNCEPKDAEPDYKEFEYNFHIGTDDWEVLFSDYPQGQEEFYELEYKWSKLPIPLDTNLGSVMISGNNHSDDLLSCTYKHVTGLIPNALYDVTFTLFIASNVAKNSVGAGGSPDLALGVGGLDTVPSNFIDGDGYYRPNFEVDLQSGLSNEIMQVVGTLGVTETTTQYAPITRTNGGNPFKMVSNARGECYLMIGWDSGFEGITTIYIKSIFITMEYVSKFPENP
ncbi:MAG: hypothetical protein JXA72_10045 [Bacteroidales bacterium]|nr:hypothetical protein [Bacteroidales bacterium]